MAKVVDKLGEAFICPKCSQYGGHVEKLAMSGTGFSRLLEIQAYRYAYVSCKHCGFTEIYNLRVLEGQDDVGNILEIIFAD